MKTPHPPIFYRHSPSLNQCTPPPPPPPLRDVINGWPLIKQFEIDYNYIEVQPYGVCFSICEKSFVQDPCGLKGSPRAYVKYMYDVNMTPYPEGLLKVCI